jgi:hypothetical protein
MSEYTQLATADGQAEEIARLHREIEQLEASSEAAAEAPPLALEPAKDDVATHVAAATEKSAKLRCAPSIDLHSLCSVFAAVKRSAGKWCAPNELA